MISKWLETQEHDFRDFKFMHYLYREKFMNMVNQDDKILDVGCGNGYFLEFLMQNGYINLWGIDVVECAVGQTKSKCPTAYVEQLDAHIMPFPDKFFDAVSCSHVLEHSPYPDILMRELVRVCKVNAVVFLEMPLQTTMSNVDAHYSYFDNKDELLGILGHYLDIVYVDQPSKKYPNNLVIVGKVKK